MSKALFWVLSVVLESHKAGGGVLRTPDLQPIGIIQVVTWDMQLASSVGAVCRTGPLPAESALTLGSVRTGLNCRIPRRCPESWKSGY